VIDALGAMAREGALPEGLDTRQCHGRAAARRRPWRHGDQCRDGAGQARGAEAARYRRGAGRKLARDPRIDSAEVAGPGFLNLRLAPAESGTGCPAALAGATNSENRRSGQGRKVNVEFVSANPTGPMHVGHTRGAVFGDALARLLDFAGYDVTREYYINDGGAQVDVLARSVYLRYLEAHGQDVAFEDGTYPGDYLVPVGRR
jgi:arginyl-tRNA synthetase